MQSNNRHLPDRQIHKVVSKRKDVIKIAKALGSPTRWMILKHVSRKAHDEKELAELLHKTGADICQNIKILEDAGLIKTHYEAGRHGVKKICEIAASDIEIVIKT